MKTKSLFWVVFSLALALAIVQEGNSQTFAPMRVNISGANTGNFLAETQIVGIKGIYATTILPQTFSLGPMQPNTNGFTYLPVTGNITFNLANFGTSLIFDPAVFPTTFRFEIDIYEPSLALPTQSLTTFNNGQIGDFVVLPPITLITENPPAPIWILPDLHFNDLPTTGPLPFGLLYPVNGDTLSNLTNPINFNWNSAFYSGSSVLNYTMKIFNPSFDLSFTNISDTSFTLDGVLLNELSTYKWFVSVTDGQFTTVSSDTFEFHTPQAVAVSVVENLLTSSFSLKPIFPNPFNPSTTIKFGIPEKNFTKVVIYNALGQAVKTLVSETLEASFYEFKWDGTDNNGNTVASGIYFARMEAGKFVQVRKMTFLK
ncbi:MAG: T9SS C-terminal target domain-containing protein [Calditrichaeota bacterium]|nr:MAG: T9SS C-terminal target domain-containing protein [Calditrichota bacterium]